MCYAGRCAGLREDHLVTFRLSKKNHIWALLITQMETTFGFSNSRP
jgi:hypothetical protein